MRKYMGLFYLLWFVVSCQNSGTGIKVAGKQETKIKEKAYVLSDPRVNSEAPYIFKGGNNKIIVNWTQRDEHDTRKNILKFVSFDKQTLQPGTIDSVPPSKGLQVHVESMAKVGIKTDGTLIAVYRKRLPNDHSRFGGIMFYSISKDDGKTWSPEHRLVADTTSTSQSFYDIALLPNGNMGLTWLDSRSKRRGKTLYFAQTDNKNLFTEQKPVAFSTCECCRTDLFVDPRGQIHIAYRNMIEPDEPGFDGKGTTEIRDMYYLQSNDTAKTFTKPIPISRDNWHIYGCPHTGPSLAFNGDKIGVIWFTAAKHQPGLFFTTKINNNGFAVRKKITAEGRHPQMIGFNGRFYAVYEAYYETGGKGYYKIMLDVILPYGRHRAYEISPPLTQNNHPVLTRIGKDKILVVWVNTDTRHPKIMYRVLNTRDFTANNEDIPTMKPQ